MKTRRFCAFALILVFAALLPAFAEGESGGAAPSEPPAVSVPSEPPAVSVPSEPPAVSVPSEPPSEPTQPRGFAMSYGYKPLVAPDGTKASNYIKGTTPPTSYIAGGGSYTVAENRYTFRDYVFAGWNCGGKLYQPGEVIYNVQSSMRFVAEWVRPKRPEMAVLGIVSYSDGEKVTEALPAEVGGVTALKSGTWRDGEGRVFEGGSAFLLSATSAVFEPAGAVADAVTVRYEGVASGAQCPFSIARGGVFTVDGCFAERQGFAFTGWESGGRLYLDGDSCEATGDTVFTPVWRELEKPKPDFCRVTLSAGKGGKVSPVGQSSVQRGQRFSFTATPDEGCALASVVCGGRELGKGGAYTVTVDADLEICVTFVKAEVPPQSQPAEPSEAESAEHSVEHSAEHSDGVAVASSVSGGNSPAHRAGAIAAAAAVCALAIVLAAWYTTKARR